MTEKNVVSCRNINIIAEYVKKHIGSDMALLAGLPFSSEHLKFEHNWIPLSVYAEVMDRAIELLRDADAPYKMGLSAMGAGSWGAIRYVQQIFMAVALGPVAVFKALGTFNPHFNATKDMSLVSSREDQCLVRIKFKDDIDPIDDFHSDSYIQGLLASVPQNWKLPLAEIRPFAKEYDIVSLLRRIGGLPEQDIVLDECELKIRGETVGVRGFIVEDPVNGLTFAPYCELGEDGQPVPFSLPMQEMPRGILITKDLEINRFLTLREGELYNAPFFLYHIQWERLTFSKKLKHLFMYSAGSKKAYLEGMERSLATVKNYVETLEDKVLERTEQLNQAKSEAEYWRDKAETLLTTMLPAHIVRNMMQGKLRAEQIYGSVMYTDLAGFTSYSKDLPPHEVEAQLTRYFTAMSEIIARNNGWVNKFLGDGILVIFGLDRRTHTSAEDAARTALEMRQAMANIYPWQTRIGIATGSFVAGEFGSAVLRRYDCVGHTMNFGSRLQSLADNGGTLVCEETFKQLEGKGFLFAPKRLVNAKGLGHVPAYPLTGHEHLEEIATADEIVFPTATQK